MIAQHYAQGTSSTSDFIGQSYKNDLEDSADKAAYNAEFVAAVREGMAAFDRGEFVAFEEFEKEFCSCATG